MDVTKPTPAEEIARAAIAFQRECTGVAPESVTVLLGEETVVVRLHEALSPAEKEMAQSPGGAAQVEEYHRQLFRNSAETLYRELKRILGVEVQESRMVIEPATGRVQEVFPSGDLVQVFRLSQPVKAQDWSTRKDGYPVLDGKG